MKPEDRPAVLAAITRHEGERSAAIAAHWMARQPEGAHVVAGAPGRPLAFTQDVMLDEITPADRAIDPAIDAAWAQLERYGPVAPGGVAKFMRFFLDLEHHQAQTPALSALSISQNRYLITTPGLAATFILFFDGDRFEALMRMANAERFPDVPIDGHPYGFFGCDWRLTPPAVWLDRMASHAPSLEAEAIGAARPVTDGRIHLERAEFTRAVREAVRVLWDPKRLQQSTLVRTRLATAEHVPASPEELRDVIVSAADELRARPGGEHLHQVLRLTYIEPAPVQKQAIHELGMSRATYRRHLNLAIDKLTDILWRREIAGR